MFVSVPFGYVKVLVAVVELPASMASVQPSPSESKSKRFGIPSLSVSISPHATSILKSEKGFDDSNFKVKEEICEVVITQGSESEFDPPIGLKLIAPFTFELTVNSVVGSLK